VKTNRIKSKTHVLSGKGGKGKSVICMAELNKPGGKGKRKVR